MWVGLVLDVNSCQPRSLAWDRGQGLLCNYSTAKERYGFGRDLHVEVLWANLALHGTMHYQ